MLTINCVHQCRKTRSFTDKHSYCNTVGHVSHLVTRRPPRSDTKLHHCSYIALLNWQHILMKPIKISDIKVSINITVFFSHAMLLKMQHNMLAWNTTISLAHVLVWLMGGGYHELFHEPPLLSLRYSGSTLSRVRDRSLFMI